MGRAKLHMDFISKEKSRIMTFKKRKEGLKKKLHQLTTLCGVDACMIIYGPREEKGAIEPDIWPQNSDETRRMIDSYKGMNKDSIKSYGLSDFFQDRAKRVEDELSKLRKKNIETRYPTWLDCLDGLAAVRLREFAAKLTVKIEDLRSRVENLKKSREVLDLNLIDFGRIDPTFQNQSFFNAGMIQRRNIGFEVINQQAISSIIHFPNLDHNQELHFVNQNSMMMPTLNEDDHCVNSVGSYDMFGGASTSGNISFNQEGFYELTAMDPLTLFGGASTSGNISFNQEGFYELPAMDPMTCYNPMSLARFYAPPPLAPTHYTMPWVLPSERIPVAMPPLPGFPHEIGGGL
ncbi:hypothetical protein F511_08742 [Dorcoceras hygrometricum]|uniref:MADS-box domain-containing protein n=1 Tax=Dorcoceras hygrometricum TaxID=472368 RepID=A0A2Z7AMN5_9LAMI|nr:hypothetical protein F511_08742 [Dorcoceras hygrometricum]